MRAPGTPRSFESRYYLGNAPWWRRAWRDVVMLVENGRFLLLWATLGRRIRREVARAEDEGRVVELEDLFGGGR